MATNRKPPVKYATQADIDASIKLVADGLRCDLQSEERQWTKRREYLMEDIRTLIPPSPAAALGLLTAVVIFLFAALGYLGWRVHALEKSSTILTQGMPEPQ